MLIDLAISVSFGYMLGSLPFGLVLVYLATVSYTHLTLPTIVGV